MKTKPSDSVTSSVKRVVSLVLALTLWTGFAFAEHQLDLYEEHHEEHHCQLFSCVVHGIQGNDLTIPVIVQSYAPSVVSFFYLVERALPGKTARSPPVL